MNPLPSVYRFQAFLVVAAIAIGVLIAWIDSRPAWDDTGITAMMVLGSAGVFSFAQPMRPWLWALSVGIWIPVQGIIAQGNVESILALVIAFVGAYAGMTIRRWVSPR